VIRAASIAASILLLGASFAQGADVQQAAPAPGAEQQDLVGRLDRIESRLQLLEANTGEQWLTRRRADEIRAMVTDVLADAQSRSALQDTDLTGGWDDTYFVQSADGNFRLEVSGQIQVRYVWNRRRRSGVLDTLDGFEIRRVKIKLDGHLITPDLGYSVGLAESPSAGFVLQSFNIRYQLSDELAFLTGRSRPPLLREEEISSKRQLAAERSLVARAFRQTRSVGVMLVYRTDLFRVRAGFMDASADNLDPSVPPDEITRELVPGERWRLSARAELLLKGRWKELKDFTSFRGDKPAVVLGTGFLVQRENLDANLPLVVNDQDLFRWTADLSCEFGGSNLFAYFVHNRIDEDTQSILNQFGVVVQGGIFVTEGWELFGRYEYGDTGGLGEELSLLTVGANRFFSEHALKWTMDVGYGFNPVEDFWSSRRAGWLTDDAGQSGQIVVRLQMQVVF